MSMKVRHNVELAELIQIPGMGFANELSVTFNPPLPHPDVPAGDTAVMVFLYAAVLPFLATGLFYTKTPFAVAGQRLWEREWPITKSFSKSFFVTAPLSTIMLALLLVSWGI